MKVVLIGEDNFLKQNRYRFQIVLLQNLSYEFKPKSILDKGNIILKLLQSQNGKSIQKIAIGE